MLATTYTRLPQVIKQEALELRRAIELTRMAGGAVDPERYLFRRRQLRDATRRLVEGRRAEAIETGRRVS